MNRIIISEEVEPYYNVALEYELLKKQSEDTILFLWQNVPSVFIGRNQNLYAECDMQYLEAAHILPVRRFSGGGAVFQDMGNLNFSFICPLEGADMEKMKRTLQEAVEALGISCTYSGRNDVLIEERKFSGHAWCEEENRLLYHGTLLLDINLEMLSRALKPSPGKLASKGIVSVRSRVINLKEVMPELTKERLTAALEESFLREYGSAGAETLTVEAEKVNRENRPVEAALYQQLKSPEWIFGQSPDWSISLEKHCTFGNVSVLAEVSDGKITGIKIYTDSLLSIDFSECEKKLLNRWFDEAEVFDVIEKSVLS